MYCKNCKHFEKTDIGEPTQGDCDSDKFYYSDDRYTGEVKKFDDKLEYWDYEGYSAGVYVGENFGCIHFKKK